MDLEDPPAVYVTGELRAGPAVAVVGTRRCTRYGLDMADEFGRVLGNAGWSVVSGMARGIDAAGHRGALAVGGHVIGVLGTGPDIWYPAENRDLYRQLVASGGALLTEYEPGTRPDRWRFPARNRLIAAIASATVVVEAGETGGALITARLAAEIGRPVFVLPGDVDRPASVGANRLIRDGAYPVLGGEDLIEELTVCLGTSPRPAGDRQTGLPAEGLAIVDLPEHWGCSITEALTRLGRLQAEGTVDSDGEWARPI
jgi:DNA processing protein